VLLWGACRHFVGTFSTASPYRPKGRISHLCHIVRAWRTVSIQDDIPAQIGKLAELHTAGILTDAEFEAKKRDLLDRM